MPNYFSAFSQMFAIMKLSKIYLSSIKMRPSQLIVPSEVTSLWVTRTGESRLASVKAVVLHIEKLISINSINKW